MLEIARIKDGLMLYALERMMPMLDSKGQFLLGVGIGTISKRAEAFVAKMAENELIKALGVIQGNQVDWELLYTAALDQMKRQGKLTWDVPLLGRLTFSEQDLRDLHTCITAGGDNE